MFCWKTQQDIQSGIQLTSVPYSTVYGNSGLLQGICRVKQMPVFSRMLSYCTTSPHMGWKRQVQMSFMKLLKQQFLK